MKKNILFTILIIYFVINVLMFINIFTFNRTIIVRDINSYTVIVNSYREDIKKIKDDNCRISLNNMLDRINDTHFSMEVKIKDYYQAYFKDNKTFIDYYDAVSNACDITYDENLYNDVISSVTYPYVIRREYLLRHEYIFKDFINRDKLDKFNDELGTYSTKHLELSILERLIKEVNI